MMKTGNFYGHFGTGVFYLTFGLIWLIKSIKIWLSGRQFIASSTFPSNCPLFSPYIDTEAYLKVIFCIISMCGEVASTAQSDFSFNFGANNAQHVVMGSFFLINAIVEVLMTRDKFKVKISESRPMEKMSENPKSLIFPEGSDYFTLLIAVFVEGILFQHHTMGRPAIDIRVHSLLVISIGFSFVAILIEWSYRGYILACMFRAMTFCIQGTWMMQVSSPKNYLNFPATHISPTFVHRLRLCSLTRFLARENGQNTITSN